MEKRPRILAEELWSWLRITATSLSSVALLALIGFSTYLIVRVILLGLGLVRISVL